jgi:hypothetical protein
VFDDRVGIIKIQLPSVYWNRAATLLLQLAFPTKSVDSFRKSGKTVCFWQRLKRTETEKTFAGQGSY